MIILFDKYTFIEKKKNDIPTFKDVYLILFR